MSCVRQLSPGEGNEAELVSGKPAVCSVYLLNDSFFEII